MTRPPTEDAMPQDPTPKLRAVIGAFVVAIGVVGLLIALKFILDHYDAASPAAAAAAGDGAQGTETSSNSAAIVGIMTPIATAIAAIVGLYFGVSATGSARGQLAEAQASTARTQETIARQVTGA
jgi:hypothetical protein